MASTSPGNQTLRVLITEDHASTRVGIIQILNMEFPRLHCGEAPDGAATLALLQDHQWDLLILDITLPGRSGIDLLREISQRYPELPVLVYSAHREEEFAVHVLRAGAAGFLSKERAPEELCQAVRQILRGGTYFSQRFTRRLAGTAHSGTAAVPHETLSPREFEVLRLIAAGKAIKTVAAELGVTVGTISSLRARILKKLGLGNTYALIQYAQRERLV